MYYRELIETNSKEHASRKTRTEKYQITLRIVELIEKRGGRFLEWSRQREMWIVIQDRNKVRTKVAAALKQYKRTRKDDEDIGVTISNGNAIVIPNANDRETDANPLLEYYAMKDHPMKRRRLHLCCKGSTEETDDTSDGSCFGKAFFPTD
eukprot:jgi/Psemu1/309873/fgenesh1_kg.563_\